MSPGKVDKNKRKKDKALYFTYLPTHSLTTDLYELPVHLVNVINCAKFYRNRLSGLAIVRHQISTFSIGMRHSINTGLELPFSLWYT